MNVALRWRPIIAMVTVLVASLVVVAPAVAEGGANFPEYDGVQMFPVKAPGDQDEFSWRVQLGARQRLRLVTETEAWVEYESGLKSFAIIAEHARDHAGTFVPTTLRVSEGDVLTLIVHDREGNPAAAGAPFSYPIVPGTSWESSEVQPVFIKGPPDEKEIAEERLAAQRAKEAQEAAAAAATPPPPAPAADPPAPTCTVPSLHGLSSRAAKAKLRARDCGVGQIYLARGASSSKGKVVKQFRPVGTTLAAGAPVAIKLA